MATIKHFRDLRAWQQCRAVRQRIRLLVRSWPSEEKFRLIDQIIRSSRGPTANISEGYGRFHEKDNIRFCRMARSSLYETEDHLITAFDEEFVDAQILKEHIDMIEDTIRTVNGYIRYLKSMSSSTGNTTAEPLAPAGMDRRSSRPPPPPNNPWKQISDHPPNVGSPTTDN